MAKWNNQKPFIVTKEDVTAPWNGRRVSKDAKTHPHLRCRLCSKKFQEGDTARWICAKKLTNFFTCPKCDEVDVEERAVQAYKDSKEKYWYLHLEIEEWQESMQDMCRNCSAGDL
jgi:hypothetical protein